MIQWTRLNSFFSTIISCLNCKSHKYRKGFCNQGPLCYVLSVAEVIVVFLIMMSIHRLKGIVPTVGPWGALQVSLARETLNSCFVVKYHLIFWFHKNVHLYVIRSAGAWGWGQASHLCCSPFFRAISPPLPILSIHTGHAIYVLCIRAVLSHFGFILQKSVFFFTSNVCFCLDAISL